MSANAKDGGQAFPRAAGPEGAACCNGEVGMSLRDWFAGQYLGACLASQTALEQLEVAIRAQHAKSPEEDRRKIAREIIARRAYLQADAMLAARRR